MLCMALILGAILCAGTTIPFARAEEEANDVFTSVSMNPANNQFASGSGSAPQTPDSWTAGGVEGSGKGNTVCGILDLDSYSTSANKDAYKLDEYEEYKDNKAPNSPFGNATAHENTNRKVLLINVIPDTTVGNDSNGTAYGYTSQSMTFTANRYYRVKVWVRTGNFASGSGAAIRLNGLDDDVVFHNINTYTASPTIGNNFNWQEYTFFIASSSYADQTVTLSLQVGDKYVKDDRNYSYPAKGYALFDNVMVDEVAPETFMKATAADRVIKRDYSNKTSSAFSALQNLDFTQPIGNDNWQRITHGDGTALQIGTYDAANAFTENNAFRLSSDPLSANGKYTDGDSSILVISSWRNGAFESVAAGVTSDTFKMERYKYYRISAWVKTQETSDGAGATLALSVVRGKDGEKYEGDSIFHTVSCTGDDANKARGGFKQHSVYVKGSVLRDYYGSVECLLGTESSPARGIAMFDNVTIEEISAADYNKYGSSGVDLDTAAGANGETPSFPSTGINNGEFYQIAEYTEFEYPFEPADWTMFTPDTAGTDGYAPNAVETKDIIGGIIPTDRDTYETHKDAFGPNCINPREGAGSVLMLSSKTKTAYTYRSSVFTAAADTPGILTVSLWAHGMQQDDYGASLVLKSGSRVLSSLENIKNTDGFKTYTFYIEPASAEITDLSLEIWLGNSNRNGSAAKLSAGYVYVEKVSYTSIEDDSETDSSGNSTVTKSKAAKFAEFKTACDAQRHLGNPITKTAYSFKSIDFTAYDYYDDNFVKYPYNWELSVNAGENGSVKYGIFDPSKRTSAPNASVPDYFENSANASNHNVLMLYNATAAASELRYKNSIALNADTYYRIDVKIKTDIPETQKREKAVGAAIALYGTDFAFTNIKTTTSTLSADKDFATYTFFIHTGSEATTATPSISLGESAYAKQCMGRVYVNSITYTDITNAIYDEAVAATKARDDNKEYNTLYKNALIADFGTSSTDTDTDDTNQDDGDNEISWWLIPSILFAIAILIAIVGFIIRKALEKKAAKKGTVEKKASYDRTATLNVEHNKTASDDEKVSDVTDSGNDEQYAAFDDDGKPTQATKPTQEAPQAAAEEPEQTEPANEQMQSENEPNGETTEAPAAENAEQPETAATETPTENTAEEAPKQTAPIDPSFDRFDD